MWNARGFASCITAFHCPPSIPPDRNREPIVLHVGAIQNRKNTCAAHRSVRDDAAALATGAGWIEGYGAEEMLSCMRAIESKSPAMLATIQLVGLYRRASIFAFPSLDEGFGIPVAGSDGSRSAGDRVEHLRSAGSLRQARATGGPTGSRSNRWSTHVVWQTNRACVKTYMHAA